ncbi:Tat proofreading chaperone DmsD [Dickeya chrysanthemi]|uniref:Tat proofreading chaperone DmsD n=1 Tax=Dickeya TaxID=204037 RepID=UPI000532DFAA|nr:MULTISPECIES: Tat proofreading chaperone DmsD [Dickeya]TYL44714.1 Tat proofreading chaperone DmsD [Dickeya sp. ws52]WJM86761.1 Tat proofreading chaperone DmsD [Dickeya chrysanthemi]
MPQHIVSLTGRLLGALLYYAPDDEQNARLIERLRQSAWQRTWPCGKRNEIVMAARQIQLGLQPGYDERVSLAWRRFLRGDEGIPAPPWGSVYLDRHNVLFGDSTLALRRWLRDLGIEPRCDRHEPEDHIGLMLMLAAWCAENQPDSLPELLSEHLLPWAMRYLDLLEHHCRHPFYQGVARLTRITLRDWQTRFQVIQKEKALFY